MKFEKKAIEHQEVAVLEDMLFLDEEELINYLDTCDAEYETYNFLPDVDSMIRDYGISEEELMEDFESEDDYWDAVNEFDDRVEKLLNKYNIDYHHVRHELYRLSGTYGNLKKFAEEYDNHIDMSNPGDCLYDCKEECDIDIESGDKDFILGKLSK